MKDIRQKFFLRVEMKRRHTKVGRQLDRKVDRQLDRKVDRQLDRKVNRQLD